MNLELVSNREKAGLRGPVKTIVDDWSTTEFDRNGKIVAWTGKTVHGRVQRTYVYDGARRLVRISGSNGNHVDEFLAATRSPHCSLSS